MKVVYLCKYDGFECKNVIPKLDERGNVIKPKEKDGEWTACTKCDRNHCLGKCFGSLEIKND